MEQDNPGSRKVRRPWRAGLPVTTTAIAAIAIAMVFVGNAAASPIVVAKGSTKYAAPYSGTGIGLVGLLTTGCGTTASAAVLPGFNLTSGIGIASVKVGAHGCGGANSSEDSVIELGLLGPKFTTTSATHNLTANWTLHFTESLAATPGGSKPVALAECEVTAYTEILDTTNGSSFFALHDPVGFQEITTGNYSHTYSSVKLVAWFDGKLVKGHDYEFEVEIQVDLATLAGVGKNSASAAVNIGSGSNSATLTSVTFR